jgi:hypothetical protein
MLATAAGSAAASLGATAAWSSAQGTGSVQEKLAALGYAPGTLGLGAAALAAPLLLVPKARPLAAAVAGFGAAATAGLVVGKVGAHAAGIDPARGVVTDDQLPEPDAERVRFEVDQTWDAIDRSAQDIVVWAPGTMRGYVPTAFADGVETAFGDRDVSLVKLPTHPNYQVVQGAADSAEALRQLVKRLDAERRPGQRILLAGESQGAWALDIALTDPAVRDAVDRAVVWGNPGLQPHQHDGAGDGKVLELTDELDVVGRPVSGDAGMVVDALTRVMDGDASQAWRWPAIAVNNAHSSSLLLRSGLRLMTPGGFDRDPHNHREFMGAAARFLADAPVPVASDP